MRLVHRPQRLGGLELSGLERRAGALQCAGHRRDRGVQQPRDLLRRPAQHLAQQQHRSLPGRQVLQRGDEREADRLALHGQFRRVATRRQDTAVGDRQDPGALRQRRAKRRASGRRGTKVHGACATLWAAQHVEADVARDGVQPRPQRRPVLVEPIQPPPGTHQGLLHGVLRLERRAQHPVAVPGQLDPELLQPGIHPHRLTGGRLPGTSCSRARSHPTATSSAGSAQVTMPGSPRWVQKLRPGGWPAGSGGMVVTIQATPARRR